MEIPYEIQIMARTVYGEARGQGFYAMRSIADVILNRANTPSWWGKDIVSVCMKPWQFSCWNTTDPNRQVILDATFEDLQLALAACLYAITWKHKNGGATHYHTKQAPKDVKIWPPSWAATLEVVFSDNEHIFYK